jgi:lactoylglutathione lyase
VIPVPGRLLSAVLYVEDVSRAVAFYESAVGFRHRFTDDRGVYAELDTGGSMLSITARRTTAEESCHRADSSLPGPPPPNDIAIEVDDVAGAVRRAVASGGLLVRNPETKYWGQTIGFVRDPDGHMIQFCTPAPEGASTGG